MKQRQWITYAAVGFIAYTILHTHYGEIKQGVTNNVKTIQATVKPITTTPTEAMPKGNYAEKKISNIMEAFVQTDTGKKFMNDVIKKEPGSINLAELGRPLQTVDSLIGKGSPALCGQKVTVHYTSMLSDNKIIDSTRTTNHPLSFELGKGSVIKGLELGIVGMRVGGIRKLTIPPSLAYDDRRFTNTLVPPLSAVGFDVELLGISPVLPEILDIIQVSDTAIGNGRIAQCGDTVKFDYTISKKDGATLFSSKDAKKSVTLPLGDHDMPVGMIKMFDHMKSGGIRTALITTKALQTLAGNSATFLPKTLKLPADAQYSLRLELIGIM